jgi:hypothetical protein
MELLVAPEAQEGLIQLELARLVTTGLAEPERAVHRVVARLVQQILATVELVIRVVIMLVEQEVVEL